MYGLGRGCFSSAGQFDKKVAVMQAEGNGYLRIVCEGRNDISFICYPPVMKRGLEINIIFIIADQVDIKIESTLHNARRDGWLGSIAESVTHIF